jgi:hypothetical protein
MRTKYQKNVVSGVKINEEDMSFVVGFSMISTILIYLGTLSLDVALTTGVISFFLLVYLIKKGF